ncbi:MAG: CHAD domain-containing protein [Akkermansiaceae bacterium]|nr:CHAD domain-containing protein [Akkermansiaceae bacterium]
MSFTTFEDAQFAREQLVKGCVKMESLLRGLLDSKGRIAEEVHATRKLGKALRGGFTLFGLAKISSPEIQVIGRLLAGPRDAVSRYSTWEKLAWQGGAAAHAIGALLEQQTHSAARRPPLETVDWCIERVKSARIPVESLPAAMLEERIVQGLKRLEMRVVKRCGILQHGDQEKFHDARKAIKAYLGAIGFLPEGAVLLDPKLLVLPELLGDENDLATLSFWLKSHGFTAEFVPDLWSRLQKFRQALQKQSIAEVSILLNSSDL